MSSPAWVMLAMADLLFFRSMKTVPDRSTGRVSVRFNEHWKLEICS
jgi:hypothetical protein